MRKRAVINNLVRAREKILELVELLPEEKWNEVWLGKWSISDLVAHLIGWDIWGLKATREILKGRLPGYYYKYYDDDWATINAQFVKKYKKGNKDDLLNSLKKQRDKLIKGLEKVPEELYHKDLGARWKGKIVTIASDTLFQAEDEKIHAQQIKKWLKTGMPQ